MNPLKALDFLQEVKVELTKVVWPSISSTLRLTLIVIVVAVIVGFFVGGIDYLLTLLMDQIVNRQ